MSSMKPPRPVPQTAMTSCPKARPPARKHAVHRLGDRGMARELCALGAHPGFESGDQGGAPLQTAAMCRYATQPLCVMRFERSSGRPGWISTNGSKRASKSARGKTATRARAGPLHPVACRLRPCRQCGDGLLPQQLGREVWPLMSVQFSSQKSYPDWRGRAFDATMIAIPIAFSQRLVRLTGARRRRRRASLWRR